MAIASNDNRFHTIDTPAPRNFTEAPPAVEHLNTLYDEAVA